VKSNLPDNVKIALACFAGGAVFVAIALVVAPYLLPLAFVAGAAVGYFGYGLREVLTAIPLAAQQAKIRVPRAAAKISLAAARAAYWIRVWFKLPHPFLYPSLLLATICPVSILYFKWRPISQAISDGDGWLLVMFACECVFVLLALSYMSLDKLAEKGSKSKKHFYTVYRRISRKNLREMKKQGLTRAPMTYANAYRWVWAGFAQSVMNLLAALWGYICIAAWAVFTVARFGIFLFRLIHSHERLLCTVDGVLGGLFVWIYVRYRLVDISWLASAFAILCGGLAGSVLGLFNWEIVSVRIMGVKNQRAVSAKET
jgi:hypothetical protein